MFSFLKWQGYKNIVGATVFPNIAPGMRLMQVGMTRR